jgi:hypothetical protein
MNPRLLVVPVALLAATVFAAAAGACSSDATTRRSGKGEACQVTNDCADGLVCQPVPGGVGGLCVLGSFGVAPTAKECVVSECSTAAECCPPPPSNCDELRAACEALDGSADAAPDAGAVCRSYDALCVCDVKTKACTNERCLDLCGDDSDCARSGATPTSKCAAGVCVQCAVDADCASAGLACVNGTCQPPCLSDGDCPGFQRCVQTRCVASGCQSDRECVASTRNVSATCGTDGRCVVPCASDLECGSALSYTFFSCIDQRCTYTGCQSDKDCRLLLTGPTDAGALPPREHVYCRETPAAGQTTAPAGDAGG